MKIALDWTPNPMHTGLFGAKHKGWLDLECVSPSADGYAVMPTEKLLRGDVDFCIGRRKDSSNTTCAVQTAATAGRSADPAGETLRRSWPGRHRASVR
jgi:hypothetical protein